MAHDNHKIELMFLNIISSTSYYQTKKNAIFNVIFKYFFYFAKYYYVNGVFGSPGPHTTELGVQGAMEGGPAHR